MERRGPSHLGPYGQACSNCFKGKSKCVARADGPGCQRCHRLDKLCQPSNSVRRRAILKKQDSQARVAELEKKLEQLTSRLETRNDLGNSESQIGRVEPPAQALDPGSRHQSPVNLVIDDQPQEGEDTESDNDTRTPRPRPDPSRSPIAATKGPEIRPDAETEAILDTFRSQLLPNFPFMHLRSQLTASQLRRDRPFVLRAIICVVSRKDKAMLNSELKRAMTEALLSEETDRTDLLLGLLIYLSWSWDHSQVMSRLMMQAVSLAGEYNGPDPQDMNKQMRDLFMPGFEIDAPPSMSRFLEHQRAVLGCFVLSSSVAAYFGQVDALRWTSQMDEGLAALSANYECPTDASFAMQVRMQLLGQKATDIKNQHQMEQARMQRPAETMSSPALLSLTMLEGELQEFQMSLSTTAKFCHLAHIAATELVIGESTHAINSTMPPILSHFSVLTASSTAGNGPPVPGERARCLWQCVKAIKTYADALQALSVSEFAGISFVQWAQIARCIIGLHRLTTTIKYPSWDRAPVRAIIDTPTLLDCVAKKLELATRIAGEQEPEAAFTVLALRMRELGSDLRSSAAREDIASEDVIARSGVFGGARAWETQY